ncbi:ankyrin repeat-containing protein [Tanacetum coccineum]
MTKVTDLEVSFEQYKVEQAASQAELKDTMEKNKADADKQFVEILQLLKTRQLATAATTIPSPLHTQPLQSYPTMLLQHPNTTTTSLPPTFTLPQPLQQPRPTLPSSTAYTSFPSFPGLLFDSQGFPIPYGPNGDFFGPFQTGEHSSHNNRLPVSTEGVFQNFSDVSLVNAGRFFPAPNQTIPPPLVHGNERGWMPGIDYRLRKLKMPLFNGDDVYGWVYLAERFFDIQGLVTFEERLKAAMMCLEGPTLSWFRWTHNREPFRSWEDLKRRMLVRFQSSQAGTLNEQFFAISQSGTARDYITMFEKIAAQLPRLQEEALKGIFIKGLKQELRTAVQTQKPIGCRCLEIVAAHVTFTPHCLMTRMLNTCCAKASMLNSARKLGQQQEMYYPYSMLLFKFLRVQRNMGTLSLSLVKVDVLGQYLAMIKHIQSEIYPRPPQNEDLVNSSADFSQPMYSGPPQNERPGCNTLLHTFLNHVIEIISEQISNPLEATLSQDVQGKLSAFPLSFTSLLMDGFPTAEQEMLSKVQKVVNGFEDDLRMQPVTIL